MKWYNILEFFDQGITAHLLPRLWTLFSLIILMAVVIIISNKPMKEAIIAPSPWLQNVWNLSQILFHLAWELPSLPSCPIKAAELAPLETNATFTYHTMRLIDPLIEQWVIN